MQIHLLRNDALAAWSLLDISKQPPNKVNNHRNRSYSTMRKGWDCGVGNSQKPARQRAGKRGETGEKVLFRQLTCNIFSSARCLSFAPHYLNAWNRLGQTQKAGIPRGFDFPFVSHVCWSDGKINTLKDSHIFTKQATKTIVKRLQIFSVWQPFPKQLFNCICVRGPYNVLFVFVAMC